jgi:DNA-directed RNA polymerase specialized sigma24 family protein
MSGDPGASGARSRLEAALLEARPDLLQFLGRHAGPLVLRFESAEDLVQGLSSDLLARRPAPPQAPGEVRPWLFGAARNFAASRRRYWMACKRGSGKVLRLAASTETATLGSLIDPAASQAGPSTVAWKREQLVLAARALSLLLPKDRQLVEWASEGLSNAAIGERLGSTAPAAARAKARALERLRKTHELVLRKVRESL